MSIVYVVMGTKGEYSDRTEWPVAAFREESAAQQRVVDATQRTNELRALRECYLDHSELYPPGVRPWDWEYWRKQNQYDPNMDMDYYTDTSYFYLPVELVE